MTLAGIGLISKYNCKIDKIFEKDVIIIVKNKFLGSIKEFRNFVESKYNYYLTLDYEKLAKENFINFIKRSQRPCVYMNIFINNQDAGNLIFMLYSDIAPLTCENFLRLCNTKRGGYSGTPIHRIVKDGWVQCGGYGLKKSNLEFENFIVPHDRRGLLCMANDRRQDCSTQFFVLLQPANWMARKYVAFGQLIDGDKTLQAIENVPTYYESPQLEVKIANAGILNLECSQIHVSKNIREYIDGHIENLVDLGYYLMDLIMDNVFYYALDGTYELNEEHRVDKPLEKSTSILKGDWCLQSDLQTTPSKIPTYKCDKKLFRTNEETWFYSEVDSMELADELPKIISSFADRFSFGGKEIRGIYLRAPRKCKLCTCPLNKICYASDNSKNLQVSWGLDYAKRIKNTLKRTSASNLKKLSKQRLDKDYIRASFIYSNSTYENLKNHSPILKEYVPLDIKLRTNYYLKRNTSPREIVNKDVKRKNNKSEEYDISQMLDVQFGRTFSRKISTDYAEMVAHRPTLLNEVVSLRRYEYRNSRPSLSVSDYRNKILSSKDSSSNISSET